MARFCFLILLMITIHACHSRRHLESDCGSYETECIQALIDKVDFVQGQIDEINRSNNAQLNSSQSLEDTSRQQLKAFLDYVKFIKQDLTRLETSDDEIKTQMIKLNNKIDLLISNLSNNKTEDSLTSVLIGLVILIIFLLSGILLTLNGVRFNATTPPRFQTNIEREPLINDDDEVVIPPARLQLNDESSSDYDHQPPGIESVPLTPVSLRK